jgi:hypothetical protein
MARDAEVAALRAVEDAYARWTVVSEQLHQAVGEAAELHAGAPVAALRADFDAQLAVTRSVAAFARTCPRSGPDVVGLPGAAFIQALCRVVESQPGLDQDLVELTRRWETWLAAVGNWAADRGDPPPARPTSPAHSRVLAAVDDWWGFGADRLHDQMVQSLATHGHHVTEAITTGAEGEVIQSAHVVFGRGPQTGDDDRTSRGPLARLRALLGHRDGR